ncbi:Predicted oxidoreductase [Pseudidiomarina planktonica]|uniref:Predicted oxidoreductase n=1 Tax=Pseudidiomarina planktonica TaxID=1323738 RepID=A0A1Y6EGS4_9GAMM|nr:aldo/keto reductase [Pseudidiomarina planktonica]RUO65917.1 hypothetical protein CWI77_05670 [Pseudidiomarina planktonica]SMQ61815.1 Predicted oxidoreductase [Pseudidiomarina planktonica]
MLINKLSPDEKQIFLGSAMWGRGVTKHDVFRMLDYYIESGETLIDHAVNYPINAIPEDYGLGLNWLSEWKALNSSSKIEVLVKIGSVNNLGTPDSDLSPRGIQQQFNFLSDKLEGSLSSIAIHWDNRISRDSSIEIAETLETVNDIADKHGLRIGISGIKSADLYGDYFNEHAIKPIVQVKENVITCDARKFYSKYFKDADYIAYGINLGGLREQGTSATAALRGIEHPDWVYDAFKAVKMDTSLRPKPESFYDISMYLAYCNPNLSGIIIGPKSKDQLSSLLQFWEALQNFNRSHDYRSLNQLIEKNMVC